MAKKATSIIPIERIQKCIYLFRGQKVMLDKDLVAVLYGVQTRDLNKAFSRNLDRFPKDFMFGLTKGEFENLKFHFGTSSWGGSLFAVGERDRRRQMTQSKGQKLVMTATRCSVFMGRFVLTNTKFR